jgi:phytoene synthase
MKADYEHCEALLRERDRERFLATLFAPAAARPHLFALYAFDLEIAHVPDAVREPMAGEIRLQWWREALAGERAEEAKANPIAAALLDTVRQRNLPPKTLNELVDARQFDLLGQPVESREALYEYLDGVSGSIFGLAAKILDQTFIGAEPSRHAGRAAGITRILRNFAFDVSKGRLFVPLDLLAAHEVHTASVLGGENSPGLRAVFDELRGDAQMELTRLRAMLVPAPVLPAFLPAALTPLYLARMEKTGYDPFRSDPAVSGLRTQFALWRAARSGKI